MHGERFVLFRIVERCHYEDTLTASVGVRTQFELDEQTWIRPGIALLRGLDRRGLDAPLITAQTTAVMIDIPMTF